MSKLDDMLKSKDEETVRQAYNLLDSMGEYESATGDSYDDIKYFDQTMEDATNFQRALRAADEFENNSIAAEAKYEGKLIYVRGPVGSVDKDILDNPYVAIRGEWDFASVQCFLTDEEVSSASTLRKGQRVVVAGVVGDTTLGVSLDGCKIISR